MRRTLIAAVLTGAALIGCRTPTSITITVTSDVRCADLKGISIVTGPRASAESAPPVTTTTQCTTVDGRSRIGTLVIVPSGEKGSELAVRVVAGIDRPVEECNATRGYDGCIVARRWIRFEPHVELALPIELHVDCKSVACDATTTCVGSGCRSAELPDPGACSGEGCLGGLDAGGDVSDAGDTRDTGNTDAPQVETGCTADQKNCDGKCVAITDPAYGCLPASCSACTGAPGTSFACVGGACKETTCKAGFKDCGGMCVAADAAHGCNAAACDPCLSDNGAASCSAGLCKLTCNSGYKLCAGRCVNVGDPSHGCTPTSCDNAACPKTGTVVCSGGACILGSCGPGTKACGGSCVPTDTTKGCGDVSRCTPCAAGESCVGGPPTTCQCAPESNSVTCAKVQCGITKNNCGQNVDCGSAACIAPKTCGGGGAANSCGCAPASPCDGVSCGSLSDSCGTSVSCGCTGAQTCVAGRCSCTPDSKAVTCEFQVCGNATNNCGQLVNCGFCGGNCCGDVCVCKTCACP